MSEPTTKNNPLLDFERIQLLFASVKLGYVGVASAIVMLYFIASRFSSTENARLWLLVVALANIPRLAVSLLFARKLARGRIAPDNILPWDRYMAIASVIAYTGFTAVIFLPFGDNNMLGTVLCAFVFMLMSTGGVMVLTTSFKQISVFLTLVVAAVLIKFLMFRDPLFNIIAGILIFGYIQLLRLTHRQTRTLVDTIALKIEHNQSSLIDPLTGLANRRRLTLHTEKLVPTAQRSGRPFSLIILDIDHFKRYNDSNGHQAGDELLIQVADILVECCRQQDLVVRYGGEEFLIVLPQTRLDDAAMMAERIRSAVKQHSDVTISAGIAQYSDRMKFEDLLVMADEALYSAKALGRDRFELAVTGIAPAAKTETAGEPLRG